MLIAQLSALDAVADIVTGDERRWRDDLAADGLPRPVQNLVVAAADGAAMTAIWAPLSSEDRNRLETDLLALIDRALPTGAADDSPPAPRT